MVQLGDDLIGLRSQLAEGSLRRAYGIEAAVLSLSDELEAFLAEHDPQEAE